MFCYVFMIFDKLKPFHTSIIYLSLSFRSAYYRLAASTYFRGWRVHMCISQHYETSSWWTWHNTWRTLWSNCIQCIKIVIFVVKRRVRRRFAKEKRARLIAAHSAIQLGGWWWQGSDQHRSDTYTSHNAPEIIYIRSL